MSLKCSDSWEGLRTQGQFVMVKINPAESLKGEEAPGKVWRRRGTGFQSPPRVIAQDPLIPPSHDLCDGCAVSQAGAARLTLRGHGFLGGVVT